jgi:hypothetical protein
MAVGMLLRYRPYRKDREMAKENELEASQIMGPSAYMPWGTFINTLDALTESMPNRIDKSVFPGQSGGTQSQLINGFRFLGLINDDGRPQPALLSIAVKDAAARKAGLRKIIEEKYADLFALNLTKTTPTELDEQMTESYAVSGDTRLKAKRFFLNAAEYLGVPISPLLNRDRSRPAGNGAATPRRRRAASSRRTTDDDQAMVPPQVEQPGGTSRSIQLKSGGTLTISASLDLFSLNPADRTFVFGLIDRLDEYEKQEVKLKLRGIE